MKVDKNIVRKLREQNAWTQEHLAALCNCSTKTIWRIEKEGKCEKESLAALSAVFGISIKQLIGEDKIEQVERKTDTGVKYLVRLYSGKDVRNCFVDSFAYRIDYEQPKNDEDAELISGVIQEVKDWAEIWSDLEIGDQVRATCRLDNLVSELEEKGMLLFGLRTKAIFKMSNEKLEDIVFNMYVGYKNGPGIIVLNTPNSP